MKKIVLVSVLLLLLGGCQETTTDQALPKQSLTNPYATKQILMLSKLTTYKGLLLERITQRLNKSYSFTIDDLSTIYNYNFTHYKAVVLLETPLNGKLNTLDTYFKDFAGVNNMIIVAVADQPFTPSLNFECMVVSPNTSNINETAEIIIEKIRTKR